MTRHNGRTITSSLQRGVTPPHEVQDILRKPVQPDIMIAQSPAAYNKE